MTETDNIKQKIVTRFPQLESSARVARQRRIFVDVPQQSFWEVIDFAVRELKFKHFCTITGLDEGEFLSFIYHLSRVEGEGITLNLKTSVPKKNPVIKSITSYFPGAAIYESEVKDLLGAQVEGLPPGPRYPLTDDWPQDEYPLRKDWKPKTEA
jgi:membrane-bound hydrogenase subunit beta